MTTVKKIFSVVLILFFAANSIYSQENKTVRIGYYASDNFFEGAYSSGIKDGYGYEYIKEIANYTGWIYEYVYGTWTELQDKLYAGEIDLLADISKTLEREQKVLFPDYPMGSEVSWIFTSTNNHEIQRNNPQSLNGKKIGVSASSIQIDDLKLWLTENGIQAEVILYYSDSQRQADCKSGKIDASVELDINFIHQIDPIFRLNSSDYYLVVQKNRPDLLEDLNKAQALIHELKPYYTTELYNKYFNNLLISKKLTVSELDYIKTHRLIRIGCLKDNLPYTGININTMKPEGMIVDWLSLLKRELELNQVFFTYVFYDSQDEMIDALKNDKVDAVYPISTDLNFKEPGLMFSSTLLEQSFSLIYSGDYSLKKYTRIAVSNQHLETDFVKEFFPQFEIIDCKTREDSIKAVTVGLADSAILNTYKTAKYLKGYRYNKLNYHPIQRSINTQFAVRRSDTALLTLLNRGIGVTPSLTKKEFVSQNVTRDVYYTAEDFLWNYKELVFITINIFVLILIIIILLLISRKKLKLANIRAEAANNAKSKFLINMSHDIRTPMNGLMGYLSMSKKYVDNKQKLLSCLNKAEAASDHLLSLVNDVLDMSSIEDGRINIEEVPANLEESQRQTLDLVQQIAEKNGVTLSHNFAKIINSNVYVDVHHLNRIVLNLLSNAIKFTKAGGHVEYTIEQLERNKNEYGSYIFTIADNGIGMSKQFQSHLYEVFERDDAAELSGSQGSGLGLAITKNLIDLMDGRIIIHSELGKGTTVIFQLDLRIQEGNFAPHGKYHNEIKYNFEGKRALIVDDQPNNIEIAKDILESAGFITEDASDGSIAVELVKSHSPGYYNYILMDIQMPYMDGYKATSIIRNLNDKEKSLIPIISMTANIFSEDKRKAEFSGMNAHVSKPIDAAVLLETLANL